MSKQTWTAVVSALLFIVCAAVIITVPIPFVTWSPGVTIDVLGTYHDQDVIEIGGVTTYPVNGRFVLTTVSVTKADANLTLPEALLGNWLPGRDVMPRDAVYAPGKSSAELKVVSTQNMNLAQQRAAAAALLQAEIAVTEVPVVASVLSSGPAADALEPGDVITAVDGVAVTTVTEVRAAIRAHKIGDTVVFTALRNRQEVNATVTAAASNSLGTVPVVGISLETGYSYAPEVTYNIDPDIGGSSGGLMLALGIYDKVSPGDLAAGRVIAGSGTITGEGKVGQVGGIQQKLAGARQAGATIFLVPEGNCSALGPEPADLIIVKVTSLNQAIAELERLKDPALANTVAGCS